MFRNTTYLFNYLLNIHLYDNKFWNIPIFSVLAFWNFKYIIMAAFLIQILTVLLSSRMSLK